MKKDMGHQTSDTRRQTPGTRPASHASRVTNHESRRGYPGYGFRFWLAWIIWFAASFVLAAAGWTGLLSLIFGGVTGAELTASWAVAVFGSWFLLVIPFMRKKERIWKRLNSDQENAVDAWLQAMGGFIGVFIGAMLFWSWIFRERIHVSGGFDPLWTKAVVVSALVLLVPFLVLLYKRAEAILKTAEERQARAASFRSVFVDRSKRVLPAAFTAELKRSKPVLANGHVVTLGLCDGRRVPHVFISRNEEILGVYDRENFDFEAEDVAKIEIVDKNTLPPYDERRWLRLDGKK